MRFDIDTAGLREFKERLERLETNELLESIAAELGTRLLRKTVKRTPVGKTAYALKKDDEGNVIRYKKGSKKGQARLTVSYTGGNLRRNWQISRVRYFGKFYVVEVYNQTEYAEFVEYGHRQTPGRYVPAIGKRLKNNWAPGKFMLTISTKEIDNIKDRLIRQRVEQRLKEVF